VVVVPIHNASDEKSIEFILNHSNCVGVVCSEDVMGLFQNVSKKSPSLRFLVLMGRLAATPPVIPTEEQQPDVDYYRLQLEQTSQESSLPVTLELNTLQTIVEKGWLLPEEVEAATAEREGSAEHNNESCKSSRVSIKEGWANNGRSFLVSDAVVNEFHRFGERMLEEHAVSSYALCTLIYTSGSTGLPKAAAIDYALFLSLTNTASSKSLSDDPNVTLSKDSLAHISDREGVHDSLHVGGRVGITSGPTESFDDIKILEPSTISCTPR
jgi:long-subunit acyl-CoA synthetase (AMP-forming)